MVTEVQFIGSPGECLHCLLCAPALARFDPTFHRGLIGRRTTTGTPRVHVFAPRIHSTTRR